jgi:hypothetical protein
MTISHFSAYVKPLLVEKSPDPSGLFCLTCRFSYG